MYKFIILLLAVAHVARSNPNEAAPIAPAPVAPAAQNDQPAPAADAPAKSDACTGPQGTFQPGERYCVSDSTNRVCNWGGEWVEFQCDPGSKCQDIGGKKVQCLIDNRISYPTGPPGGIDASGSASVGAAARLRRNVDAASVDQSPQQSAAASVKSDTCTGPQGTYQPGDRYCVDETTSRVCSWEGVWVDQKCDEPKSKCQDIGGKKVQCLVHEHIDYPTGPPAGFDASGLVSVGGSGARRRRDDTMAAAKAPAPVAAALQNDQAAAPTATKSDTCTGGPGGNAQPGDRYCVDKKKHRVCNWGGEWVEDTCPEDSECMALPSDSKKVQCFKFNRNAAAYPTGPPAGQEADQPSAAQPQPPADSQAHADAPVAPLPVGVPPQEPQPAQPQPTQPEPAQPQQPQPQPQQAPEPAAKATGPREPKECPEGLKEGETLCTSETAYKQCHDGTLVEDRCPDNAKCLKAKESNHILCRETRLNSNTQGQQQQEANNSRRRF